MDKIDKRNLINQKCKVLSYYVGTIADIQKPELCNTLKELEQLLNNEKQRLNSAIYSNVLLMLAMTYYVDLKDYRKASLDVYKRQPLHNPEGLFVTRWKILILQNKIMRNG